MKGIFVGVVLVIAILTLVVAGELFVVFSSQYVNLKISLKSSEILKATDIVEAVKRGLEVAYNYSFIQAAYDIGKLGGYDDESSIKEWRNYDSTNYPLSYIDSLETRTKDYIKIYLKNLDNFTFSEPYVDVVLYYTNNELKLAKMAVYFYGPLNYSGHFFSIYDNPNRTISLPLEYFKLYDVSRNLFIEKDSVREAIENAENKMEDNCKKIELDDVCENKKESPEEALNENCPNADEKFKEKVINEIETPKSNDVNINLHVDTIKVKHKSEEKYGNLQESSDCDCKSIGWQQVDNGTTPCNEYCDSNNYQYSKFENNQCFCGNCTEHYKKYYNLRYKYSYFSAVRVIANITTKSQYLVYDATEGNVKLRNFTLTFNLTTSNDYNNWRPI